MSIQSSLLSNLRHWKQTGLLAFAYSLLAELLILLYLLFFSLFTLEILLPGFVSVRINMALFFAALFLLTFFLAVLGSYLNVHFPNHFRASSLLAGIAGGWAVGILSIALFGFPLWSFVIILGTFLAIFLLARSFFLEAKHSS